MLLVLMGVAGCGKSTVGEALAARLGWVFLEGDRFHSLANVEKMSRGVPLTDSDREPWLDALGRELSILSRNGKSAVASCSALRETYRERLRNAAPDVRFVHLDLDRDQLEERLRSRQDHFVDGRLLESQLAILERSELEEAFVVDAAKPVTEIVDRIAALLDVRVR